MYYTWKIFVFLVKLYVLKISGRKNVEASTYSLKKQCGGFHNYIRGKIRKDTTTQEE